jgi:glycosyltransferase involved in cell wall biosynthesis
VPQVLYEMNSSKLFTGVVIVYNEDEHLQECLESLSFCSELIVVDLGSEDQSVEIALEYADRVLRHKRVPTAGIARDFGAFHARNDWIVFLDPDEIFPTERYEDMCRVIQEVDGVGRLYIPWKFYFKGRPLEGTRWGGRKHKGHVVHRNRCFIGPPELKYAHREVELRDGYEEAYLSWQRDGFIKHFWMDSYRTLVEKHLRYVRNEGMVRYDRGERFPGWVRLGWRILRAFKKCFVDQKGWRERGRGLFLSIFWAWYQGASLLSLRRYQRLQSES